MNKQNLPVVICVTSQKCSHCISLRGDDGEFRDEITMPGNFGRGWSWGSDFFKALLTGAVSNDDKKCSIKSRVFNIHYDDIRATASMRTVIEFIIDKNGSVVKKYDSPIPPQGDFIPYVVHFPAWVFFDGKSWDIACNRVPYVNNNRNGVCPGITPTRLNGVVANAPYNTVFNQDRDGFIAVKSDKSRENQDIATTFAEFVRNPKTKPSHI